MGPDGKDDKEIVILGRIVKWCEDGIRYQADPKHRQLILEHFGLNRGSRALKSNGEKEVLDKGEEQEDLDTGETTVFRGLAARVNLLSLDCPDLQCEIKQSSSEIASPKKGSWRKLKRVARYLLGVTSVEQTV